jgi:hypothetical protein
VVDERQLLRDLLPRGHAELERRLDRRRAHRALEREDAQVGREARERARRAAHEQLARVDARLLRVEVDHQRVRLAELGLLGNSLARASEVAQFVHRLLLTADAPSPPPGGQRAHAIKKAIPRVYWPHHFKKFTRNYTGDKG